MSKVRRKAMACRHDKGGICTSLRCREAGSSTRAGLCAECRFAEGDGETLDPAKAASQLTPDCPPGAVLCQRCQRPCRRGAPNPKAQMLRESATTGFCLDCAVTDWLRSTYPVNLLLRAAPMLATEAAQRDQMDWDADGDWGLDSFSLEDVREREQRLGKALVGVFHGDTSELDALEAEAKAAEDRRLARQIEASQKRPERMLLLPQMRESFADIMASAFAQARPDEINWQWIVANWGLPFPAMSGRHRKRGATWP